MKDSFSYKLLSFCVANPFARSFPLYVVGFPSLFGGAGAELFHQLKVWHRMHVDVHIIPTQTNVKKSQLYPV